MDILQQVAIELPCNQCGHRYQVTLAQILVSHDALANECAAGDEAQCEPLFAARLVDHHLIATLRDAWEELATAARVSGGALQLAGTPRDEEGAALAARSRTGDP